MFIKKYNKYIKNTYNIEKKMYLINKMKIINQYAALYQHLSHFYISYIYQISPNL